MSGQRVGGKSIEILVENKKDTGYLIKMKRLIHYKDAVYYYNNKRVKDSVELCLYFSEKNIDLHLCRCKRINLEDTYSLLKQLDIFNLNKFFTYLDNLADGMNDIPSIYLHFAHYMKHPNLQMYINEEGMAQVTYKGNLMIKGCSVYLDRLVYNILITM